MCSEVFVDLIFLSFCCVFLLMGTCFLDCLMIVNFQYMFLGTLSVGILSGLGWRRIAPERSCITSASWDSLKINSPFEAFHTVCVKAEKICGIFLVLIKSWSGISLLWPVPRSVQAGRGGAFLVHLYTEHVVLWRLSFKWQPPTELPMASEP